MVKPSLSIIIVSYNAKYYLHLTLSCLAKVRDKMDIEIIVVDNNSSEDIPGMVQSEFPETIVISNHKNLGFAKANNIGISHARSENILILNPDTIISEEIINQAIELLYIHEDTGAVAVRMIDGNGDYLPESARGFPNLKSSFLKLLGFGFWSDYYRTQNMGGSIEVMSGACMFFKKEMYESIGGLDERYFMYGEDIDISYQLHKAGLKIRYLDAKEIVHFKGRSSIKSNWRYQKAFYNAMKLYWQKNFSWGQQPVLNFLLNSILWILKAVSFLHHGFKIIVLPILDFVGILSVSWIFSYLWSTVVKGDIGFLPKSFYIFILPIYTLTSILSMLLSKFYLFQIDISKLVKASVFNLIIFLCIYFVLPVDYKYSRAVMVSLIFICFFIPLIIRWVYSRWSKIPLKFLNNTHLIAKTMPSELQVAKLKNLIEQYSSYQLIVSESNFEAYILDVAKISNETIIDRIKESKGGKSIWLYAERAGYLIQSLGRDSNGLIIAPDMNYTLYEWTNQIRKRILDICLSILALLLAVFSRHSILSILKSSASVLFGNRTWINIDEKAVVRLSEELVESYRLNYSMKKDIYYFFRYMFIS